MLTINVIFAKNGSRREFGENQFEHLGDGMHMCCAGL